jgi:hypothetical protein
MQSQNQDWRARARKRFRQLAWKEAVSALNSEESVKLERYSVLRRKLDGSFYSTPFQARREWCDKRLFKKLRREAWVASDLRPNADSWPITPEDFLSAPNKSTWTTYVVKNSVFSTALGKTEDVQIIVD